MTKKLKVLAVDDESINRLILEELLIHDYELISLSSGKECLDYLQKCPQVNGELPFLILLDVGMPDTSGLEVCKKIKRGMKTKQIQIVFISSLTSEQQQIDGYNAGGDDYVNKPFIKEALLLKVKLAEKNFTENQQKDKMLTEAMTTAMRASLKESESSNILACVHELYNLTTNEAIVKNIQSACQVYGVQVIVSYALESKDQVVISSKGSVKPLEIELIQQLRHQKDIYNFGNRTLFSSGDISLLVLNMPLGNPSEYKHLLQHLEILIKGADSRVKAIVSEKQRDMQRLELIQLVSVVQQLMESLERNQIEHQKEYSLIMNNLTDKVEESFLFLALTEVQEDALRKLIGDTESAVADLFDKGADLQEKLTAIKMLLQI